ncbi:MAG: LysM peptidoglycan-binding domain-containing protein [Kiritimatiellae bacterium]|nr:LysM peptidoglycan-binding domain-containing protein [Kiritimatiellia bacterium]
MAFERGRFGVEYDPRQKEQSSGGLGWVIAVVALLAFVSLVWTLVNRYLSREEEEPPPVEAPQQAEPQPPPATTNAPTPVADPPAPKVEDSAIASGPNRPVKLRNLLMRLDEAKRRRDVEMEVTTIEQIRALPGSPAADLDKFLAPRLGTLNIRRLFDLRNAQWVKQVVVKRGDVASRIASENGSTLASLARLNGGNVDKVVIGQRLYVMDHPRFNLVIRRRARIADLLLNGKFFKRYSIPGGVAGKDGMYEFPSNPKSFWRSHGVEFKAADRAEIEMLMPARASVIVSEM